MDLLLALLMAIALAPPPAAAARTVQAGVATRRWYEVVPAVCAAPRARCMTVIVLHGGGGVVKGEAMARSTGFAAAAERDGFILLAPDAQGDNWNDGRPELAAGIDDIGFFRAMLADLGRRAGIDPVRIVATGGSNGGLMSFRLACDMPEVRAIAPVIANLGTVLAQHCRPPRPVPVFQIVGTADRLMPYEGGAVAGLFARSRGTALSADATFRFWAQANGCRSAAASPERGGVIVREAAGCPPGAPVRQWSLVGVGHGWPGRGGGRSQALRDGYVSNLDATVAILAFFREVTARP